MQQTLQCLLASIEHSWWNSSSDLPNHLIGFTIEDIDCEW